jgi:hypothetical protein
MGYQRQRVAGHVPRRNELGNPAAVVVAEATGGLQAMTDHIPISHAKKALDLEKVIEHLEDKLRRLTAVSLEIRIDGIEADKFLGSETTDHAKELCRARLAQDLTEHIDRCKAEMGRLGFTTDDPIAAPMSRAERASGLGGVAP